MSITNDFFVYFQGEEDYFLKIKTTYTKYSSLFQLFGSFLGEFVTTFNLKNINTANTNFYYIDIITDKKTLVTNFSLNIPDSKYEYLIRLKEITDDSYPNTISDPYIIDSMIEKGKEFESKRSFFTAYSFYSVAGKKAIPNLIKMFYKFNDFESIAKYLNVNSLQVDKDPYLNEILGYTYEYLNNKAKAIEEFSIFKDKEPIQSVAYNRLLFSSGPMKTKHQSKISIEKEILSCMKLGDITFEVQSLNNNSFYCIPPRSEKIYTHEVLRTLIDRSLYKEAIEFCVKNVRFFIYNLPLLAANNTLASNFVSAISNPTLTPPIATEVCMCFILEGQTEPALKLATYLFNRNKTNVQSLSNIMYVYYFMLKFDEVANIVSEMIENSEPNTSFFDIQMDDLIERIIKVPDFNKDFGIDDDSYLQNYDIEPDEEAFVHEEYDGNRYQDRFNFVIFIVLYLLIHHHLREVNNIFPLYSKAIKFIMKTNDEVNEIFNVLSQIQANIVTSLYFSPENKKFFVFGDMSVFIFANVVFKVTDKPINGESDAFIENIQKNKSKSKSKNVINLNDFQNFWSYQAMMNQDEDGFLVQAETLVVPEFSLWRVRDEKRTKPYIKQAFDIRLNEIKEALAQSKSEDDPVVFSFVGKINKIRTFLPKAKILILFDYSEFKHSKYAPLFYEAICQNIPANVEIIVPIEKYNEMFASPNAPFSAEKILDAANSYLYQQFIDKNKKLYDK